MMTIPRTVCLGFLAVILVGAVLLELPFSLTLGQWGDPINALFISTSAVCVTGLATVDIGTYYTGFGQLIVMLLAQVGGLGYMTVNTFLLLLLGQRFRLREKVAIQQTLDLPGIEGAKQLIQSIIALTLLIELTGAFLLMFQFVPEFGASRGIWLSIFHSVSAFNNAGFSLFRDNLMGYADSPLVIGVISLLIISGGIGYKVLMEIFLVVRDRLRKDPGRFWVSLNFKVVTTTTFLLLSVGTFAIFFSEFGNPKTLGEIDWGQKLLSAWFQSVTARTAGFNSIDQGSMTTAGLFITIALMFIGASPGGTGGGIKTTTMRVLTDCTVAVLRGKDEVICFNRRLPNELIFKAVGVVFGSLISVILCTIVLSWFEPKLEFINLFFEVVSAYATVGVSMGITSGLSVASKLVVIFTMYTGRVGILLLMTALLGDPAISRVRYPEDDLLVG